MKKTVPHHTDESVLALEGKNILSINSSRLSSPVINENVSVKTLPLSDKGIHRKSAKDKRATNINLNGHRLSELYFFQTSKKML